MSKESRQLIQIRAICKILLSRLEEGDEIELCEEYRSDSFTDSFDIVTLPKAAETGFIVAYSFLLLFALITNSTSLVLLCKRRSRSSHNSIVLSLIASNCLLLAFCVPFNMAAILNPFWDTANIRCKMAPFLQTVAVIALILIPVLIAVDRYFAIVHPIQFRSNSSTGPSCIILVFVWCVAIAAALPNLYWFKEIEVYNINVKNSIQSSYSLRKMSKRNAKPDGASLNPFSLNFSSTRTPHTSTRKRMTTTFSGNGYLSFCVHDLEHVRHLLIYRACMTAMFFACFIIIVLAYSAVTYRLFKRSAISKTGEDQPRATYHNYPAGLPASNADRENVTPLSRDERVLPLTMALLPGYVYKDNQCVENNRRFTDYSYKSNAVVSTLAVPNSILGNYQFSSPTGTYNSRGGHFAPMSFAAHLTVPSSISREATISQRNRNSRRDSRRNLGISTKYWTAKRSGILFAIGSLCFIITWSPILVFELLLSVSGRPPNDRIFSCRRFTLQYIACLNACINPILYSIFHDRNHINVGKLLNRAKVNINKLFCCKCFSKSNKIEPSKQSEGQEVRSYSLPVCEGQICSFNEEREDISSSIFQFSSATTLQPTSSPETVTIQTSC